MGRGVGRGCGGRGVFRAAAESGLTTLAIEDAAIKTALLMTLIVTIVGVGVADGATIRVMRDGTGAYTTIQPAIDAAASGDTILIGPGNYTEMQSILVPGWEPTNMCVYVRTTGLTLMGTSRDEVVIGPLDERVATDSRRGIVFLDVARGDVSNLTVVNCYDGILANAAGVIDNCVLRSCEFGVTGVSLTTFVVSNSQFVDCYRGAMAWDPTLTFTVSRSTFQHCVMGVSAAGVPNARIEDCVATSGVAGFQMEQGARGSMARCRALDMSSGGIGIVGGSIAVVDHVETSGGFYSVWCTGYSQIDATSCIFRGATMATMVTSNGLMSFHNCHLLSASNVLVDLHNWLVGPVTHLDMKNNYWGFSDRDSIAARILDGNSLPLVMGFVDFEPFSATPLPAQKKSLGGVKGLYR